LTLTNHLEAILGKTTIFSLGQLELFSN
jgi:hypothetical protein